MKKKSETCVRRHRGGGLFGASLLHSLRVHISSRRQPARRRVASATRHSRLSTRSLRAHLRRHMRRIGAHTRRPAGASRPQAAQRAARRRRPVGRAHRLRLDDAALHRCRLDAQVRADQGLGGRELLDVLSGA